MADTQSDVLMIVTGKKGRLSGEGLEGYVQRVSGSLDSDFFTPLFDLKGMSFAVGAAASLNAGKGEAAPEGEPGVEGAPKPAKAKPLVVAKKGQADLIDMQPVTFTRLFDAASTQLFTALCTCETLPKISIIKRKAAGTKNGGEAYLRLDFMEVLVIGLDWREADDVVEEEGTFIYRKLQVSYRPQKNDGTLDATKQTSWSMKA